jgi:hypothetical protein
MMLEYKRMDTQMTVTKVQVPTSTKFTPREGEVSFDTLAEVLTHGSIIVIAH